MIEKQGSPPSETNYSAPARISSMLAHAKRDAILQSASGALVVLDSQGIIISFNSYAEEQFNLPKRKAIGVHVDQILNVCELTSNSFYEWLKLLDLESQISHTVVLNFNKADGSKGMAEVTVGKAPLEHPIDVHNVGGAPNIEKIHYQYICVIRPVYSFKGSQIEDTLKYLSHTLKTPLFGMLGLITLALGEKHVPTRSKQYLDRAIQSGEVLANTIERALNKLQTNSYTQPEKRNESKKTTENITNKGRFSNKNILIVEDNQTNQVIAKGMLEKFGIKPHIVENGKDAIAEIKSKHYDLILMDCNMPIMDGYTATKIIRELPAPKNSIPIIAITATHISDKESFCETNKMDDYIAKPYRLNDIHYMLHFWLS